MFSARWARELLQALDLRLMAPEPEPGTASTSGRGGSINLAGERKVEKGGLAGLEAGAARFLGVCFRRLQKIWISGSGSIRVGTAGSGSAGTQTDDSSSNSAGQAGGRGTISSPSAAAATTSLSSTDSSVDALLGESVEWVNMCWRKMWRVYQVSTQSL